MEYTKKVQKFEEFEQVYESSNYSMNEEDDDLLYSDESDEYSDFDDEDDSTFDSTDDYSDLTPSYTEEDDLYDEEDESDNDFDDDEDLYSEEEDDDFDDDEEDIYTTSDYEFESDDDDMLMDSYDEDYLSEAALKQSATDRKRGSLVSQLMRGVNKDERYITARDKFVDVLQKVAKDVITQEKMKLSVLKMLNKVTLKEINA